MSRVEVFYLPLAEGRRFCILHSPRAGRAMSRSVLYLHPFGDEMNKSRRMAALQARALADAGWMVLQIDLFGCGDSEGQFEDALWSRWVDDVLEASTWLRARSGTTPMLWGMRLGCLLAGEASRRMASPPDLLAWQPVHSGKQFLQQFLRLKLANQLFTDDSGARLRTEDLRAQLTRGEMIEIGGYMLSPGLARGIEAAELAVLPAPARVAWLEIVPTGEPSPASTTRAEAWRSAGTDVDLRAVAGPPFWQTQELTECPELIEETLAVVEGWQP